MENEKKGQTDRKKENEETGEKKERHSNYPSVSRFCNIGAKGRERENNEENCLLPKMCQLSRTSFRILSSRPPGFLQMCVFHHFISLCIFLSILISFRWNIFQYLFCVYHREFIYMFEFHGVVKVFGVIKCLYGSSHTLTTFPHY